MKSIFKGKKTRVVGIAICVALMLSIGAMSTFAATSADKSLVKNENGVVRYSTDGGATWSEEAPEGMTQITDGDGPVLTYVGNPPDKGVGSLAIRNENGVTYYQSADGSVGFGFGSN